MTLLCTVPINDLIKYYNVDCKFMSVLLLTTLCV